MNIRKFAYSLAVIMLSYDVLSTMIKRDSSEFKNVSHPGNSININRWGYSGCIGWEKIVRELKAGKPFYFLNRKSAKS